MELGEDKSQAVQMVPQDMGHRQDLRFHNMPIPQYSTMSQNATATHMTLGFNQIVQQMQPQFAQPPTMLQAVPLPVPIPAPQSTHPQIQQTQQVHQVPQPALSTSPTLYRQSLIASPEKPTASRLIVKPNTRSDS